MVATTNLNYDRLAYNILLYEGLSNILPLLQEKGTDVILLKGVALAETIYPHIGLRAMSDIDLLVRKEDFPEVQEILLSLGYELKKGSRFFYVKKDKIPLAIDLHYDIAYMRSDEINRVWKDALRVKVSGIDALIMSPEDTLIYVIIHFVINHGFPMHKWMKDIDLLVGHYRLNWKTILQRARAYHLEIPIYYTLYNIKERFRTAVPQEFLDELKPKNIYSFQARLFESIFQEEKPIPYIDYLLPIIIYPGMISKMRFISPIIFPTQDFLKRRYNISHPSLIYLYYFIRLMSLFFKSFKALQSLIFQVIRRKIYSSSLP